MITPKDILKPQNKSGYAHVVSAKAGPGGGGQAQTWRAQVGSRPTRPGQKFANFWWGPTRSTPLEAAQDYCDHVNKNPVTPSAPGGLKRANHPKATPTRKRKSKALMVAEDIVRDARAQINPRSKGFIYCVSEEGAGQYVKIGWTKKDPPEARLGDYQTGNPRKLVMLASIPGRVRDEKALQRKYLADNVLGEWFHPTDALLSEFGLTKEDIA